MGGSQEPPRKRKGFPLRQGPCQLPLLPLRALAAPTAPGRGQGHSLELTEPHPGEDKMEGSGTSKTASLDAPNCREVGQTPRTQAPSRPWSGPAPHRHKGAEA